jgi:hypothetical protein
MCGRVVPLLCGVLFGPLVGFLVGFLGSTGSDLVTFGFYWNWSLGNGLAGLVAGATPFVVKRAPARVRGRWPAIGAVANLTPDAAISAEWIPLATWDLLWGLPMLLITLSIWALAGPRVRAMRSKWA